MLAATVTARALRCERTSTMGRDPRSPLNCESKKKYLKKKKLFPPLQIRNLSHSLYRRDVTVLPRLVRHRGFLSICRLRRRGWDLGSGIVAATATATAGRNDAESLSVWCHARAPPRYSLPTLTARTPARRNTHAAPRFVRCQGGGRGSQHPCVPSTVTVQHRVGCRGRGRVVLTRVIPSTNHRDQPLPASAQRGRLFWPHVGSRGAVSQTALDATAPAHNHAQHQLLRALKSNGSAKKPAPSPPSPGLPTPVAVPSIT